MHLTSEQVAARLPVWRAFADLFLDTDVSRSYTYIRRTMRESGLTEAELWRILSEEVAPAFCFNMREVVGEWAMWEDHFIQQRILFQLNQPAFLRPLLRLGTDRCQDYAADEWKNLLSIEDPPSITT